jgi:hypothetical protein
MKTVSTQAKLPKMNRIPSRGRVEPDPPRLIEDFKTIVQDIENESMAESTKLFQQSFGLTG